jgi:hypothetical protein
LRIKVYPPFVDVNTDLIFVQFFAVAGKGLFANKLEESALFGRVRKALAVQYPAELFSLFKERNQSNFGRLKR